METIRVIAIHEDGWMAELIEVYHDINYPPFRKFMLSMN